MDDSDIKNYVGSIYITILACPHTLSRCMYTHSLVSSILNWRCAVYSLEMYNASVCLLITPL